MVRAMRMTAEGPGEAGAPPPERVIAGDPRFRTWNLEERDGLYAGIWEATPGTWRIEYDEWEYCRILSGRSVVTSETGEVMEVGPGDGFVLRPGFKGTWEVVETTRTESVVRP